MKKLGLRRFSLQNDLLSIIELLLCHKTIATLLLSGHGTSETTYERIGLFYLRDVMP